MFKCICIVNIFKYIQRNGQLQTQRQGQRQRKRHKLKRDKNDDRYILTGTKNSRKNMFTMVRILNDLNRSDKRDYF